MSKNTTISALKPILKDCIGTITPANAGAYGGRLAQKTGLSGPSITSALAMAVVAKAKKFNKGEGLSNGVDAEDWVAMGKELYGKVRHNKKENAINAVCDTCSGLVLYVLRDVIRFSGRVELVADKSIHHHYIVVDRNARSRLDKCKTWGSDCFVIDLWQAKFAGNETTYRGLFSGTAHHFKHGIYRNPIEHVYTRNNGKHLKVDEVYDF